MQAAITVARARPLVEESWAQESVRETLQAEAVVEDVTRQPVKVEDWEVCVVGVPGRVVEADGDAELDDDGEEESSEVDEAAGVETTAEVDDSEVDEDAEVPGVVGIEVEESALDEVVVDAAAVGTRTITAPTVPPPGGKTVVVVVTEPS